MAKITVPKITARKYEGDDAYSWAVFIDGTPFVKGLSKREAAHYKELAAKVLTERYKKYFS